MALRPSCPSSSFVIFYLPIYPSSPIPRILPAALPGTFEFDKRGYFVKESCGEVVIVLVRVELCSQVVRRW